MATGSSPIGVEELAEQLAHPSPESVWRFALDVFGDETKARSWMDSRRQIFGNRSPQDLLATGDTSQLRTVLEVLIRIDYGVYS